MSWSAAFIALLVSHMVGDVLLQTDWQALNKVHGLAHALGRRALTRHVLTYMLAFIPALVLIGRSTTAWRAIAIGVLVGIPHLLIDDGTFVRFWLREIKGAPGPAPGS